MRMDMRLPLEITKAVRGTDPSGSTEDTGGIPKY